MPQLFSHHNRNRNAKTQRIYAIFEVVYTIVDFSAAFFFTVGSVLFFWKSLETPAIWCFVIGSVLFMVKPSLRLARELKMASIGDTDDLAQRYEN